MAALWPTIEPEEIASFAAATARSDFLTLPAVVEIADPASMPKLAIPTQSTVAFQSRSTATGAKAGANPCQVPPRAAASASAAKASAHSERARWPSRARKSDQASHAVTHAKA